MKILPLSVALLGGLISTHGEEPALQWNVKITSPIADGKPSPPAPPPVLPDFLVKSTVVREMEVVESPPMSGLPPVEGTITATVHLVEDPGLPDPIIPAPRIIDPAKSALFKERAANYAWPVHASVSATVYDRKRTLLKWSFYGNDKIGVNPRKNFTAWSNVDFSYIGHFSTYQVAQADGTVKKWFFVVNA